mmetsp:Transcript_39859/g.63784  ORF Transcript_39859/g.63784 Transcript_39859/m.63784 type:complete len:245 (-) Transcript_39859:198-932(-)
MSLAIREVENIDREVKRLLKEIEEELQKIENGLASSSSSGQVKKKIEHTKSRIKTMEIELQTVENRETARKFKPVIRDHRSKLKEFEDALKWSQAGAADDTDNNRSGYNEDEILRNEDTAIGYGRRLQDETEAAADRAIRDLAETQEVAVDTAEKVNNQTEQIARIDQNLAEIDDEIDRATRVLKRMGRRVMTDKYIWILIFLIFAAIITIIVVSVVKGKVTKEDVEPNFRRRSMLQFEFDIDM